MTRDDPSASSNEVAPGVRVTRSVVKLAFPFPFAPIAKFGASPACGPAALFSPCCLPSGLKCPPAEENTGEDAATQAIADLHNAPNWDPGGTLRALIGKAGFILLDAAPRSGNAMNDVPPALKAVDAAYQDLKASTGFECPQG